ncbi:MAG: diadenosine tetraphosphate hydrolase, partial [Candidatus Thermoplasmatota archaeon]
LKLIEGFKEKINYFYKREGETIYKEVIYLLAESNTFYVKLSYEHTDFAWLDYEDAIDKITYENEKKVLRKAYEFICQNLNSE